MTEVKSKNMYELLGNDPELDPDREPEPPTKAIDKPIARAGKREAPKTAPVEPAAGARRGNADRRGGGFTGSERAFRDRTTGRNFNRDQPTGENDDGTVRGRDSGPGTQRRGRGQRGPRRGGDRHVNRTGITGDSKQGDQAWGAQTGEGEWADERAGDAQAAEEIKESGFDANDAPPPVDGTPAAGGDEAQEAEPEDTHKSYTDYLAEQAAKKMQGLGLKEARAPNEGAKDDKKWKGAKELVKGTDNEDYFKGEEKARRERERSQKKSFVDIDYAFKEQPRDARGGSRGGRGRGRGRGEFRGEYRGRGDRGDRGDRPERGDRPDRGDRGDRPDRPDRPERGSYRGGRGRGNADSPAVAVNDESAFPSLGK